MDILLWLLNLALYKETDYVYVGFFHHNKVLWVLLLFLLLYITSVLILDRNNHCSLIFVRRKLSIYFIYHSFCYIYLNDDEFIE